MVPNAHLSFMASPALPMPLSSARAGRWQELGGSCRVPGSRQTFALRASARNPKDHPDGDLAGARDAGGLARTVGLEWNDSLPIGSAPSLATLALALVSIPALAALGSGVGMDEHAVTAVQLWTSLSVLMAGIPSFRRAPVFMLLAMPFLGLDSGLGYVGLAAPFLILAKLLTDADEESATFDKELDGEPFDGDVGVSLSSGGADRQQLTEWEERFGVAVPRDADPCLWTPLQLAQAAAWLP
ncbi:hypothetical protein T484DRAFT_1777142 [Baffinella frigidus]|nr:hypothetical protein T484DRAFT_1777142 [Cryptophyta sp. CCMP2293]